MKAIRRNRRWKHKKRPVKTTLAGILFICLFAGVCQLGDKSGTLAGVLADEIKKNAYTGIIEGYMPGMAYGIFGGERELGAAALLKEQMERMVPLYGYLNWQYDYETPAESELSYETILQLEALDENYIDEETGEVVLAARLENEEQLWEKAEEENERNREKNRELQNETTELEGVTETEMISDAEEKKEEIKKSDGNEKEPAMAQAGSKLIDNFPIQAQPVVSYSREKLNDFDYLIQNFYTVDCTTTINSSQLSAAELLSRDMKLVTTADQPQILIYHTHSQELYADSTPGDVMTGVVGCGEYLAQLLREEYGLNVIHHTGQYDVEKRDYAYANAAPAIEQLLAENPSIEVVIDLHRDAVPETTHLVREIGGMQMAPVMFFNGLSRLAKQGDIEYLANPYIQDNLALSLQMELTAEEYYPNLTRHIYLKGYRYNMHYRPKTLLIELGAQTNTFAEAKNAIIPLADVLSKVLCQ